MLRPVFAVRSLSAIGDCPLAIEGSCVVDLAGYSIANSQPGTRLVVGRLFRFLAECDEGKVLGLLNDFGVQRVPFGPIERSEVVTTAVGKDMRRVSKQAAQGGVRPAGPGTPNPTNGSPLGGRQVQSQVKGIGKYEHAQPHSWLRSSPQEANAIVD